MSNISEDEFAKRLIAQAYSKLLCIPGGDMKVMCLARIGSCEVRMCAAPRSRTEMAPLFSIELFDHDADASVDRRACCDISQGVAAYREFVSS